MNILIPFDRLRRKWNTFRNLPLVKERAHWLQYPDGDWRNVLTVTQSIKAGSSSDKQTIFLK